MQLIQTEADGEVDIASFSDNKYGEKVGVLSTSIKSVWEENQTLTEVLQHAIKECEVDLIDAYEATHGDLMTDCKNALSEKTGSMLEDRGVLEEERELWSRLDICAAYWRMNSLDSRLLASTENGPRRAKTG